MTKKLFISILLLLLCAFSAFAHNNEYVEGEVIVVIDDSYSSAKSALAFSAYSEELNSMALSFAESVGLVSLGTFPEISRVSGGNMVHLKSETKSTEELLQELIDNPNVKSIQPNYIRRPFIASKAMVGDREFSDSSENAIYPNDPLFEELWGMMNIGMPQVWEYNTGSDNVCVAVIDTGIDYNHEDLRDNMARDSLGNYGRRFTLGTQSDNPMDTFWHGTHVAGIIGAVGNNGVGVAGVNWRVKLLAVNVMPRGDAIDTDIIAGISYVLAEKKAGLNIRVANMSFGGWSIPGQHPEYLPLGRAIKSLSDAGILCVMAVSNEGQNISNPVGIFAGKLVYPACFKFANTISVGSINSLDGRTSNSDYSSAWVNIAAPGEKIYSTILNNRYGTSAGTSMSAPHVAGAAAILCAAYPNETAGEIKERLLRGARSVESNQSFWESGLLDVARAYGVESESEQDALLESVSITGENSVFVGDISGLSHTKFPLNTNGYFEYLWESSDESIALIEGANNPSAEIKGISNGSVTITLSVTQTLQNGTKTTKSDSVDISVNKRSSSGSSWGCNSGLFTIALLLVLSFLKRVTGN
ncbi:MAG: S8 family serine peptidase [Synergistaceae bacterium]|nr:S8 family serine peptidase [Synergistaceae bacterium]